MVGGEVGTLRDLRNSGSMAVSAGRAGAVEDEGAAGATGAGAGAAKPAQTRSQQEQAAGEGLPARALRGWSVVPSALGLATSTGLGFSTGLGASAAPPNHNQARRGE